MDISWILPLDGREWEEEEEEEDERTNEGNGRGAGVREMALSMNFANRQRTWLLIDRRLLGGRDARTSQTRTAQNVFSQPPASAFVWSRMRAKDLSFGSMKRFRYELYSFTVYYCHLDYSQALFHKTFSFFSSSKNYSKDIL